MLTGEIILNGRYKLLQRIGSGGMSLVYKAQDLMLGRLVAVKVMHESLTDDEGFLQRFQQEAHAVANLTHPNIVTVHDIGQDEDGHGQRRHYIVMEHVEGRTLKQIIREVYGQNGRYFPLNRALDLTIQICAGIGYAHRANLVHCDVKPQNVLVTHDDRVKVADFGIARAISQATSHQPQQVWGTPQYFAPEQAAGEAPTPSSDVYAIGVILFELLSGQLPFTAESHTALALKHLQEEPPLISQYNPTVPRQIEQIIKKVMAKEPAGRYRTAGQLGRILHTYRQTTQEDTGPIYPLKQRQPATDLSARSGQAVPVTEQPTQIYERPDHNDDSDQTPVHSLRPVRPTTTVTTGNNTPAQSAETPYGHSHTAHSHTAHSHTVHSHTVHIPVPAAETPPTDWIAIGLGFAALILLLGLIPLWYAVYQAWAG
jgi:eukaryotic-like serine/threonine-protein kinase